MKNLVLIQARCGSTRFPNKVLTDISGKTDIQWVIERVKKSRLIDEVMVVTSIEKNNLPLINLCTGLGVRVFAGSEDDVLDRFYQAAKLLKPERIIRITADCPLFDWQYLDMAIEQFNEDTDYMGQIEETFPDGLDIEIFTFETLFRTWKNARLSSEREHVTPYMRNHPELFKIQGLLCPVKGISDKRWTLDEDADLQVISRIYEHFVSQGQEDFLTGDILDFLKEHPEIEKINSAIGRNEGYAKSLAEDRIVDI